MDPDMYDEFGNYIGPDLESESDSESEDEKKRDEEDEEEDMQEGEEREEEEEMAQSMAIVLHEDKKYYPTAGEVPSAILSSFFCTNSELRDQFLRNLMTFIFYALIWIHTSIKVTE